MKEKKPTVTRTLRFNKEVFDGIEKLRKTQERSFNFYVNKVLANHVKSQTKKK